MGYWKSSFHGTFNQISWLVIMRPDEVFETTKCIRNTGHILCNLHHGISEVVVLSVPDSSTRSDVNREIEYLVCLLRRKRRAMIFPSRRRVCLRVEPKEDTRC